MQSAIAFGIFIAIAGYFIARSNDKDKAKEVQVVRDELTKTREATKTAIHSRAIKLGVDLSDEQLDWVCSEIESDHGKAGLVTVKNRFGSADDKELIKSLKMIEAGYHNHLEELEVIRLKSEADRKWQAVLEDFKRLNPAQRKKHLEYIKKHTNELSDEQLHVLELICLGDSESPEDTNIMVGDMKLFSVRKK